MSGDFANTLPLLISELFQKSVRDRQGRWRRDSKATTSEKPNQLSLRVSLLQLTSQCKAKPLRDTKVNLPSSDSLRRSLRGGARECRLPHLETQQGFLQSHRVSIVAGLVIPSLLLSSCGSSPPRSVRAEQFLPAPQLRLDPDGNPTDLRPPVSIYIDGSGSMRGFVTDPAAEYPRLLRAFSGKAISSYDAQIYKFTSDFMAIGHMAFSQVQTPGFYNGLWTPLSELFRRIVKDHEAQARISVIVSDLVQSERLRDHTDLMRSIRQLNQTHQEVVLLAFRSHFHGNYETETRSKRTYPLDTSRPFYVLIIAPDAKSLLQFRREVLYGVAESREFRSSGLSGSIRTARYAPKDVTKRTWNLKNDIRLDDGRLGATRLFAYFHDRAPHQVNQGPLQIELTFDGTLPRSKTPRPSACRSLKLLFPYAPTARSPGPRGLGVIWEPINISATLTPADILESKTMQSGQD